MTNAERQVLSKRLLSAKDADLGLVYVSAAGRHMLTPPESRKLQQAFTKKGTYLVLAIPV